MALQLQKEAVNRSDQETQTDVNSAEIACQTDEELVGEEAQRLMVKSISPTDLAMFIQNQNEIISHLNGDNNEDKMAIDEPQIDVGKFHSSGHQYEDGGSPRLPQVNPGPVRDAVERIRE